MLLKYIFPHYLLQTENIPMSLHRLPEEIILHITKVTRNYEVMFKPSLLPKLKRPKNFFSLLNTCHYAQDSIEIWFQIQELKFMCLFSANNLKECNFVAFLY